MAFTPAGAPDPACAQGNGDITEVTARVCRTSPFSSQIDREEGIEAPCIFPFTLNGESHDSCIFDSIEDFTRPVFRCPIRTLKGIGTNFDNLRQLLEIDDVHGYYCPTNR